jgi:hemolysin D
METARLDASLPLIGFPSLCAAPPRPPPGNRIAYLEAQTRLVDQRHARIVQQRKLSEIEAARHALERQLAETRSAFERQVLSDLSDAQKKRDEGRQDLIQDLIKAERKLEEQVLRSPIDGTVQQLAVHTIGGVVTPAQQLMMIVPLDSQLEAEAMIPNRDIGFVNAGQDAEIKIDTFNFTRYGLIHGKVATVSQDSIVRDKSYDKAATSKLDGGSPNSSEPQGQELLYAARIALATTQMQVEGKLVNLAPGMAVTVEIKTGTRRIIEYLMSPLLRYRHESLRER